ncbi:MAG TPA: paraquat-inducible protein A [Acetobacteraceae bacterium]|nr:paraquat-inducible protein A [Acetobacteraceae bacterium]
MIIACSDCGTIQQIHVPRRPGRLVCCRCDCVLERSAGRALDYALALSLTTLLLLFPANLMTLFRVSMLGMERTSHLGSGVIGLWQQGFAPLAIVVGLQGIVLPFFRFGLLATALGAVRCGTQGPWIGAIFRWAERLDVWAMPDVFLIGAAIGYSRVAAQLPLVIAPGGWCLVSAAALAMLTRASLDRRAIWRHIGTPPDPPPGPTIACRACDLVVPQAQAGGRCPRCLDRLHPRVPFSVMRASALVAAGYLLYPVANYFPMSVDHQLGVVRDHTIANGVAQLLGAGLWPLAAVIFTTSIAIPLLKLVGLTWLIWSVRHRRTRHLVFKTKLYRVIREIGRWSNVDVFTIAIFLPLMRFDGLVSVRAATGASAFLAVIVLTMLAARLFDTRLLWDLARP